MALVDQIDKLACGAGDALGTGQQACPIDWDRIQLLNLHQKVKFIQSIDSLETVRTAQQLGKAVIINNIDRLALVPQDINRYNRGSGKRC
jgi:hypothetical protein